MCLITFEWQPGERLVLSANRDEFFHRPSAPLGVWEEHPHLVAGRDLEQGGSWLGVSRAYRFAALTNVRAPGAGPVNPRSRGHLVSHFLIHSLPVTEQAQTVMAECDQFAPFNLLLGDREELWYITNHPHPRCERLPAGLYGLSNSALDTPWPKTRQAKQQLQDWLKQPGELKSLATLLQQRTPAADHELPTTGIPLEWERLLSAQFIQAPGYGTRCSTGLWLDQQGAGIAEISWDPQGNAIAEHQLQF